MTESQTGEDEQAWNKAKRDLAEARAMDLAKTPSAAVHKSYYAMHHAARAVLLRLDGKIAAVKHGSVIGRFGQIAKSRGAEPSDLMAAGRDINRVYEDRKRADYDVEDFTAENDALDSVEKAKNFLKVCAAHFKFD